MLPYQTLTCGALIIVFDAHSVKFDIWNLYCRN